MIIQLTGVPREITLHLQHDPDAWVHTFVTVKPEVLKKEAVRLGEKQLNQRKVSSKSIRIIPPELRKGAVCQWHNIYKPEAEL